AKTKVETGQEKHKTLESKHKQLSKKNIIEERHEDIEYYFENGRVETIFSQLKDMFNDFIDGISL
ncbi:15909_t:CDS:1, partial [Acaulospora colombiana]